jgi:hypothetical protein
MAHFAQLNENSVVTQVIVVNNPVLIDPEPVLVNGVMYTNGESEARGIAFCKGLHGEDTNWAQTSYNGSFRGKYAAIGDTFDVENNVFVSPVVESAPVTTPVEESVPVVEAPQETVSQAQVDLTSTDIPALTSSDVAALTSEQITGL